MLLFIEGSLLWMSEKCLQAFDKGHKSVGSLFEGHVIVIVIVFLSDPGVPGVRSMGSFLWN